MTYNNISDNTKVHGDFYLSSQPTCIPSQSEQSGILSNRRGAIDYGSSTRSPLSPVNFHAETIRRSRVLPQKILNPPRSENAVQSIWFNSKRSHERDGSGIAMVDALDHVDGILAGPHDEVFQDLAVSGSEVKFNILVCPPCRSYSASLLTISLCKVARIWAYILDG